ncbi:MAG: hypothetical protein LBL70_05050 [Treponema sp.]|nr:hypothetical protein [Treponema sp.]
MKGPLFVIFALWISASALAVDFGFIMNFQPVYDTGTGEGVFTFTRSYIPWVSFSPDEKVSFYISARVGLENEYKDGHGDKETFFEFDRAELNLRVEETVHLTFGRQRYRDSGGMIASGLFDGFNGTFGLGRARITGSVFSTAPLRKKTAEILITETDREAYRDSDQYFASNRVITAFGVEFPDLTSRTSLTVSGLGQFDLNGYGGSTLHSQYFTALYRIEALNTLRFVITGIAGVMESSWAPQGNLAGALTADWDFPGGLSDMVTGEMEWGSGEVNSAIGAFIPVNRIRRGTVFTPVLSGIMDARLSYRARLHHTLSFNAASALFFRTDLETFRDTELDLTSKDRYLGTEIYGQMIWAPQSPLRVTAGGGVFLPGGAFVSDADPKWKIDTGLIFSL